MPPGTANYVRLPIEDVRFSEVMSHSPVYISAVAMFEDVSCVPAKPEDVVEDADGPLAGQQQ